MHPVLRSNGLKIKCKKGTALQFLFLLVKFFEDLFCIVNCKVIPLPAVWDIGSGYTGYKVFYIFFYSYIVGDFV